MSAEMYAVVNLSDEDYGPRCTGYSSNDSLFENSGEAWEELVLTRGEAARNGKPGRYALASVTLLPDDPESLERAIGMVGWTDPVAEAAARVSNEVTQPEYLSACEALASAVLREENGT